MCGRMTCWPDGLPAVTQEALFPLTSFFPTEPMPVPTSQLHGGNHIQRRESSGGNDQHMSAMNNSDANSAFYTQVTKRCSGKREAKKKVNHTRHTNLLFFHYTPFPSQATPEQGKRAGPHHKTPKTVTWAPENNGEELKEEEKVTQEVLEQRRLQKLEKAGIKVLPAAVRYSRSGRRGMRASAVVV